MPIARTLDEGRDQVAALVERFGRNLAHYRRPEYKEAQVRIEFINPFLEALGWDVGNVSGFGEQYKDVIHEDALKVGGKVEAPDYCVRIGPTRKFFLEAKKPAVSVRTDVGPAYQLRRYAWSAKLPLSILTDFEEFSVYDCLRRPSPGDTAAVGRVTALTFDQYVDRFADLHAVFAKESVLRGSFDRYAEDSRAKRGTGEVDAEFLKEIEGWREALARNLALRNGGLSVHELNFAVQHTIDRILFLRIAEDRGIEIYGRLLALAGGRDIYARLVSDLFRQADEKYNSGLFDFGRDRLSPSLKIDDRVLKPILTGLYYPASPYEFSVLPVEVLGQVYEQFLGKVIRLTPGHVAKVEEKPEVRKAGGVYYTPAYIVDYIVRQTVGRLVEGKGPRELRDARGQHPLRVLDPACGSGSFLLGAYQFLLDHYRRWYEEHDPAEHARGREPALYQGAQGDWRLTTAEKKRILLDHIYGVDIDRQAVEVTKLSLLLKVLEGESEETVRSQLAFWQERALPDLGNNCKCGNSLIGPDYFEGRLLPDDEEMRRVNPFDWESEFPAVFTSRPPVGAGLVPAQGDGGFDAIIGNPPYVRQETLGEPFKAYAGARYQLYAGTADLYVYFIERAMQLLRPGGYFSYIVANKWMRAGYGRPLRRWLKDQHIVEIVDFGDLPVFETATTYPCILVLRRQAPESVFQVAKLKSLDFLDLEQRVREISYLVVRVGLDDSGWSLLPDSTQAILDDIRSRGVPLGEYVGTRIYRGLLTGFNEAFVIDESTRESLVLEDPRSAEVIRPFLAGRDVRRYAPPDLRRCLIVMPNGWTRRQGAKKGREWEWLQRNYPAVARHLAPFQVAAEKRWDKGEFWWELRPCDYYAEFEQPKVIAPAIVSRATFSLDLAGLYSNDKTAIIRCEDYLYVLGVLNSALTTLWLCQSASTKQGGYFEQKPVYLAQIPIARIDPIDPADVARHDRVVALVEQMLDLHKKLAAVGIPEDRALYQRQIEATDRQIDALVYELYGLTEEEIAIAEGASA
ncbi:MAG TPA: Eco57I restriction-modification methylase domain-containing protein [Anaerolineae bacterium]|nr:Eco57I restriction-modification methylase domain-containing protein [Anaerolineae bacterium]